MAKKDQLKLDALTAAIEKLVAHPVAPVAPIAPILPIAPIAPIIPVSSGDHDLLQKLDVKVDQIQIDISALKLQNNIYVTQPEHKEVIRIITDHEARIRIVETAITKLMQWGVFAVLLVGVLEFLINKFWK